MNRKKTLIICAVLLAVLAVGAYFLAGYLQRILYPTDYSDLVVKYAEEYGVPESLIYAVIRTESGFDPEAVSKAGAVGLMQLMPDTFDWLTGLAGEKEGEGGATDPEANIRRGVCYLKYLHGIFGSDSWETEIAAYNAGQGRVAKWLADPQYSDDGVTLKNIPITETANHVEKVAGARKKYVKLYGLD